ncbi:MAG: purine-nucleoside phosphorylase [Deltaproteobacteria bacterium]|nr:purine-nucleoside phosphorylase [Deltaproteobacteria bacterium]
MSLHIEAKPDDIAPVVLLPGDPLRAKWIAEQFLERAVCHNQVRNALGFTGFCKGKRISVQSTGMGMPSHSIYVHELLEHYRARVLVRVGTCGSLQPHVALRDLVLASSASTDSAMNRQTFSGMTFAPTADFELLRFAYDAALKRGLRVRTGNVLTSDTFYSQDLNWWKVWAAHGVLAAEMETAALYTLCARAGARALSILTVSDHIVKGESASAEERQQTFERMIELALEVAVDHA